MKLILEDNYTFVLSHSSSASRQTYTDYTLAQSVEADRCVAVVECHIGYWYSNSQRAYGLGVLAELTSNTNLRIWMGGISKHDTVSTFTFTIPVTIYRFESKPRRIETVMTTNNGYPSAQSVALSSAVDRSKTVVFNNASAGRLWYTQTFSWDDSDSITFTDAIGCIVVEL